MGSCVCVCVHMLVCMRMLVHTCMRAHACVCGSLCEVRGSRRRSDPAKEDLAEADSELKADSKD